MLKLLIHAGMPKAGSTALQARLKARRPSLRKSGILYPTKTQNHNFLMAGAVPIGSLPRIFRQHYRNDKAALRRDFDEFWDQILRQIENTSPEIVVMSGENLWTLDDEGAERLRQRLGTISDDIHVVCYVRRPSDFYLSAAQQKIKASHVLPKAAGVKYRRHLEAMARLGAHLHVHAYARGGFIEGDVCLDFAERHLGNREHLAASPEDLSQNESLSAEAMAILQDYRAHAHSENDTRFTKDTNVLIRELRALSTDRPSLRPEIKQFVDNSSVDLNWLRDTYDVVFSDIDYGQIRESDPKEVSAVADICPVDEIKKTAILNTVLQRWLSEHASGEAKFRTVFKGKAAKG